MNKSSYERSEMQATVGGKRGTRAKKRPPGRRRKVVQDSSKRKRIRKVRRAKEKGRSPFRKKERKDKGIVVEAEVRGMFAACWTWGSYDGQRGGGGGGGGKESRQTSRTFGSLVCMRHRKEKGQPKDQVTQGLEGALSSLSKIGQDLRWN